MALFQTEGLIYYYPDSPKPALSDIHLCIEEGEFFLVTGGSGSGKSSLARAFAGLIPYFYGGRIGGKVYFRGQEMTKMDQTCLAREIGMIFQDPEKQLVMTSVEAEIAFGLENLGLPQDEMGRRIAEVMTFLDLKPIRNEFTALLSGGQKQKVALAAILAMHPKVLILDEPTSQLDPVAAEEFFNLCKRLNEEMGITIILIEQRLERCFHLADRVLLMEAGQIKFDGSPQQLARWAAAGGIPFVPPVSRLFAQLDSPSIPVTVKEARQLLRSNLEWDWPGKISTQKKKPEGGNSPGEFGEVLLSLKEVWFTYPNGTEALQDISLHLVAGEFMAILGANGSGKSTLLRILAGLLEPGRGQARGLGRETGKKGNQLRDGRLAYLSQNPNDYLFQDTVEEELLFTLKNFGLQDDGIVEDLLTELHLKASRSVNPRDLSGGERQRVALASVLVTQPRLLILDEPTRGMDYRLKEELGEILTGLNRRGVCVVLVTHDVEFAAEYASRALVIFAGRIVSDGPKHRVLGQSIFYSTQVGKMCHGYAEGILTWKEAMERLMPVSLAQKEEKVG